MSEATIWKYPLNLAERQDVSMPCGAQILGVHAQGGAPCLWALVDPLQPSENRVIQIFGTGNRVNDPGAYIGTCLIGAFVWHVFEVNGSTPIH